MKKQIEEKTENPKEKGFQGLLKKATRSLQGSTEATLKKESANVQ